MPIIQIKVENKIATAISGIVVCGNSDYIAKFDFDAEWQAAAAKTARFIYGDNKFYDVAFSGDECPMPIFNNTKYIAVGVYAGDLKTTTPAMFDAKKSVLCGAPVHVDPPEDVYNQILQLIEEGAIKGEKGDKGDRGERGERGEKGEDGHVSDDQIDEIANIVEQRVNVPTKTSQLQNDSGFIDDSALQGYAKTEDLAAVATSGSYNDLANKPTIPSIEGLATEDWVEGKGYLTEVPQGYATDAEVTAAIAAAIGNAIGGNY